jgi:hypothetical protein
VRLLSNEEATAWCAQRGIEVDGRGFLSFPGQRTALNVSLHHKFTEGKLIYICRAIAACPDLEVFDGGLLWIREWGVWNELDEAAGKLLFERARGDQASLYDKPAIFVEQSEFTELHAFLVPAVLVGWDAFFVPKRSDFIIFHSHDCYLSILSRDVETDARLRDYFSDLQPQTEA